MKRVKTGLDVLVSENFKQLRGLRVGLVAHPVSVDSALRNAADLLEAAPSVSLALMNENLKPVAAWHRPASLNGPVTWH
jgi:uncharacterized protein YbbC (DUF1343 family)